MGVFGRIFGCILSCFGVSTRNRNSYPDHDIPKVLKQSVSHSYQARSTRFSHSTSQRSSCAADRPSCSGLYQSTSAQPRQSSRQSSCAAERPSCSSHYQSTSAQPRRSSCAAEQPSCSGLYQSTSAQQVPINYYLRNISFNLKAASKDHTFMPERDVIYHNQWTACCAKIIDKFGNELSSTNTVKLSSSSHIEFRDCKVKNGRLHFTMNPHETGDISITIKVDSCRLTKAIHVVCNPCSSVLSTMVVKEISRTRGGECTFRISIVDVFGEPVPSNSPEIFTLEVISPAEHVVEKRMYCKDGNKYFDITVRGHRSWSRDIVVLLNGKSILSATKFEVADEECIKIESLLENRFALLERDQVSIHNIVERDGSRIFIPFQTGADDGEFVPYNGNNCVLQQDTKSWKLICKNAKKYDILGEDFAHTNNIKRVIELNDRIEIQEDETNVIMDMSSIHSSLRTVCKEVVQHLLCGLYYRKKAAEAAKVRMEWKKKFDAFEGGLSKDSPSTKLCRFFKDLFGDLMNRYNRKACDELFEFFNFKREVSEVDLHGLLVADEKKLESLKLEMLRGKLTDEDLDACFSVCKIRDFKGRSKQVLKKELLNGEVPKDEICEFIERCQDDIADDHWVDDFKADLLQREKRSKHVNSLIKEWRSESDEAIAKLKEALDDFDLEEAIENKTPWLEIIVGAGRHSRNEQKIRPKVEELLKERNLKFTAVNKGALVVTFKTYSGLQPCFGEYYCENCDRCWKSSKSYVGKYQKCSRCQKECWPVKQRAKEKVDKYAREGAASVKRKSKPHQSHLCQRCQELGRPCNEKDYYDPDDSWDSDDSFASDDYDSDDYS